MYCWLRCCTLVVLSSYVWGLQPFASHKRRTKHSSSIFQSRETDFLYIKANDRAGEIDNNDKLSAFQELAEHVFGTLIQSDCKRNRGYDGASTGWTAWVDEKSSTQLQNTIDHIQLVVNPSSVHKDEYGQWIGWIRSCPAPMMMELTPELRDAVSNTSGYKAIVRNRTLGTNDSANADYPGGKAFLNRIGMRLIYLPSGSTLSTPLQTAPGAMVHGKLLSGGRRAGERTVIFTNDPDNSYSWLQYGGPERNYEALDIGFCLLLEIILLPSGLILPLLSDVNGIEEAVHEQSQDMIASNLRWRPEVFLSRKQPNEASIENAKKFKEVSSTNGNFNACSLETNFCASIGGLQPKIHEIIRRVLDGRVIQPVSDESNAGVGSISCELDRIRRQEMEGLLELGLRPVKGVLLYGPPGCGKTHLSRQISKILDARPPKIIAAPELLDRWVGGTEQMVRELFADAEYELQSCGGDPTKSALHVIVIDEIDAVFRKRSALDSSSEVTRASAVNQILAKLDGMQSLENILFIGMTNRRELLDKALLRPGRLECQIEIPLPDQNARREILKIHFGPLRERGRLSRPLCNAIDGIGVKSSKMDEIKRLYQRFKTRRKMSSNISDLASDYCTHSFSGADLAGLVRNAGSIALARARMQGEGSLESLQITLTDVDQALREIKQQKYFQ